jgi:Flp pilus assembly protein TadD/TolB-like protein
MENKARDDELLMSLVEWALAQPENQRESLLESACSGNSELFEQARDYVQREARMHGFLLDPLFPTAEDENPFESGQLLDARFRIVRELARGGMGIVYEAVDEKLGRRIAIKCARPSFRKWLPPEVRNASEISHPNVCKIFEIHTASTSHGEIDFITMEFLEGETLAERLRRERLPEEEARAIALQLCAGLAEAHRNEVVHGDLKSNNIILSAGADGTIRAVITDFGLARRREPTNRAAESGEVGGTPDYMAPELWRGEEVSVASDIFALGVILYELVSGRRPFESAATPAERITRNLPPTDRRWDRILASCLDPDPARRCPSVHVVAEAFAPPRHRRWFLTVAATVVLTIATVGTYQRATAPKQTVRLALLPFGTTQDIAPFAADVTRKTADQLAHLRSTSQTRFTFIPLSEIVRKKVDTPEKARVVLGATHALRGTLEKDKESVILHAYLADARSGVNMTDWQAQYDSSELRYAPVALTGLLTSALRLPPIVTNATVNANARRYYEEGLSYVHGNIRPDDSVALLEQAAAADRDSPLVYAGLAEAQFFKYLLTHDSVWKERAQGSVRQAEIRNLDLPEVHAISGLLKANSSLYEQAEVDYERAVELQPNNGDAYRRLSGVYNRNAQFSDALAAIRKAIQVQPDYFKNYQQLGALYNFHGKYQDAIRAFQKMVDLAPDLWESHFALGAALENAGRFGEAEREVRAAIRLQDSPRAEHELGQLLQDLGRNREAIACFLKALALGRKIAMLWLDLGVSYSREGLERDSRAAFRRGLEVAERDVARDPRDGSERAPLAYLAARLGDSQRAESEITQALRVAENDSSTCLMAVLTYEALGHREQSLSVLASAPSIIVRLNRYPELAELRRDPRFLKLLGSKDVQ